MHSYAWFAVLVVGGLGCGREQPRPAQGDASVGRVEPAATTGALAEDAGAPRPTAFDAAPVASDVGVAVADTGAAAADTSAGDVHAPAVDVVAVADDVVAVSDTAEVVNHPPRPAAGVLTVEQLDALWEASWEPEGPSRKQPFAAAKGCAEAPDGEACVIPTGLLAVKDAAVLVRAPDDMGGCGDADESWGWVARPEALTPKRRERLFIVDDETGRDTPAATWRWLAARAADGFTPAESLAAARVEDSGGIRSHFPIALLRAPLERWFLVATTDKAGATTLALVSPDNQRRHELGSVPRQRHAACSAEDRAEGMCGDLVYPTIVDAVLSADRSTLFVLGHLGDGSHCGPSKVFLRAWPLPKAVTPTP